MSIRPSRRGAPDKLCWMEQKMENTRLNQATMRPLQRGITPRYWKLAYRRRVSPQGT
ncbi:unnamed protein product [Brassica oleracea]